MDSLMRDADFRRQMILEKYRNHARNVQSLLNALFLANAGAIAALVAFFGNSTQSGTIAVELKQVSHWLIVAVGLFVASVLLLAASGFLSFSDQRRALREMALGERDVLGSDMSAKSRIVLLLLIAAVACFLAGAGWAAVAFAKLFWVGR